MPCWSRFDEWDRSVAGRSGYRSRGPRRGTDYTPVIRWRHGDEAERRWEEKLMTPEDRFNEHYKEGSTPWDIGKPDFNLVRAVSAVPIAPCKALDIGCGTGDNAIWLSEQGFTVVGVDTSEIAIEKAREKAAKAKACTFAVWNILK